MEGDEDAEEDEDEEGVAEAEEGDGEGEEDVLGLGVTDEFAGGLLWVSVGVCVCPLVAGCVLLLFSILFGTMFELTAGVCVPFWETAIMCEYGVVSCVVGVWCGVVVL